LKNLASLVRVSACIQLLARVRREHRPRSVTLKQKERTLAGPLSRVEMIMSTIKLRNALASGKADRALFRRLLELF
jgi:hypothetical protein